MERASCGSGVYALCGGGGVYEEGLRSSRHRHNMRLPPAAAKVTHRESINIPGRLIHKRAAAESSILHYEVLNFEGGFLNFIKFFSVLFYGK